MTKKGISPYYNPELITEFKITPLNSNTGQNKVQGGNLNSVVSSGLQGSNKDLSKKTVFPNAHKYELKNTLLPVLQETQNVNWIVTKTCNT